MEMCVLPPCIDARAQASARTSLTEAIDLKTELLPTERFQGAPSPSSQLAPVRESPLAIVPRLAGYGLLAFIAWLLLSTLLEPWLSNSATRAVLNAPAVLITTPISGTVSAVYAQSGQPLAPGQAVAVVKNGTVARDVLTSLLTQRLALQSKLDDLANRIPSNQRMLDYVNEQYRRYQGANVAQLQGNYASLQAQQDAASSKISELQDKYQHAMALQSDGAVSAAAVSSAQSRVDVASMEADALDRSVQSAAASLAAAKRGIYVASGQSSNEQLTQLSQRRAELQSSIAGDQAQLTALNRQMDDLNTLVTHEEGRVHALSDFVVKATGSGTTQDIVTPVGTQVTAGATLVRATDCSKTDVVAVFPARMAGRLNIGTPLRVRIGGTGRPRNAHITQILPAVKDSLQNTYSAPFPYAENGSVYTLAQWDDQGARHPPPCEPGRSVVASLR